MRVIVVLLLFCTAAVPLAHASVYVSRPLGDKPHVLVPAEWEGKWAVLGDDHPYHVTVLDAANGYLLFTRVDVLGNGSVTTYNLVIRESGGWLFATWSESGKPDRLQCGRLKRDDNRVTLWQMDANAVRKLIYSGKLRGEAKGDDVLLHPPAATEMKALTTGALGVPFNWDRPDIGFQT